MRLKLTLCGLMKMWIKRRLFSSAVGWLGWLLLGATASAQWNALNPIESVQQQADGPLFTLHSGTLKLQVCSDSVIHVIYSPASGTPSLQNPAVVKRSWAAANWTMDSGADAVTLSTSQLKVTVLRKDASVTFSDLSGKQLFQQTEVSLVPVVVNGEKTYHAELFSRLWGSYESFYGLGQHQAGVWNYRGRSGRHFAGQH